MNFTSALAVVLKTLFPNNQAVLDAAAKLLYEVPPTPGPVDPVPETPQEDPRPSGQAPGSRYELSGWKLTLPIATAPKQTKAPEIIDLREFQMNNIFELLTDG